MKNIKWHPFYYNGIETNIEVTKCGKVKRVPMVWIKYLLKNKFGEINFAAIKPLRGYNSITALCVDGKYRTVSVHQAVASVFLGYKFSGNDNVVDHIDSNKFNNDLNNLRIISNRENISKERNIKRKLPVGVSFYKRDNKYRAQIKCSNKNRHLGYFDNEFDAHLAYESELNKIHQQ